MSEVSPVKVGLLADYVEGEDNIDPTVLRALQLDDLQGALTRYWTCAPERPDYFTHWGGAFKCAAAQLGLAVGDHPDSRPPQQSITEAIAKSIREIYEASALADDLAIVG